MAGYVPNKIPIRTEMPAPKGKDQGTITGVTFLTDVGSVAMTSGIVW